MGEIEEWREVAGTGGRYEASCHARVRLTQLPIDGPGPQGDDPTEPGLLKQRIGERGFPLVSIVIDTKQYQWGIHRCMLQAFVGNPPSAGHRACFKDGDPTNLALSNLAWMTALERNDGTGGRGKKHQRPLWVVRGEDHYQCTRCLIWQPARRFYALGESYSVHGRVNSRCGLHSECPSCGTDRRRESRRAAKANGGKSPTIIEKIGPMITELDDLTKGDLVDGRPTLAERLHFARKKKGITQAELARRASCNEFTIARLENGERLPRMKTMRAIVNALRTPGA